jgi:hypothetical protein
MIKRALALSDKNFKQIYFLDSKIAGFWARFSKFLRGRKQAL